MLPDRPMKRPRARDCRESQLLAENRTSQWEGLGPTQTKPAISTAVSLSLSARLSTILPKTLSLREVSFRIGPKEHSNRYR
jgi:hypothetical protein